MVRLDTLTEADLLSIVEWRKADPAGARTPYDISIEQERSWFSRLQEPGCRDRYWAVWRDCGDLQPKRPCYHTVGLSGLTGIEWENGRAEIAMLVDPSLRGKGMGSEAVRLTLEQAFDRMRLASVYGEVYECNKYMGFWLKVVERYHGDAVTLPMMKWWDGRHWGAYRFTITAERWRG